MLSRPQHLFLSSALSILRLQVTIVLGVSAAGLMMASALFPGTITRYPLVSAAAACAWGAAVGVLALVLFSRRRTEGGPQRPLQVELEEDARALVLIVDLPELLANQVGKLARMTGADRLLVFLRASAEGRFEVRASRGYNADDPIRVRFREVGPLARWLLANEDSVARLSDGTSIMDADEVEKIRTLRVNYVIPLVALNRLVGMVFFHRIKQIDDAELARLTWYVPQLALSLTSALLHEQQRERVGHLRRTERLVTAGQLAAGAAHEIGNPLAAIRSTIQYVRRGLAGKPLTQMDNVLKETDRIETIVRGMLAFARPPRMRMSEVDLASLVKQTIELVAATARSSSVEIHTRFPDDGAVLRTDGDQIRQVLLNVVMNAIQAMPDGGLLSIDVRRPQGPLGGPRFEIAIRDQGVGIPERDLDRIFTPFYTTKQDGTGLGLAISHTIVEELGGELALESEEGRGTEVRIRL